MDLIVQLLAASTGARLSETAIGTAQVLTFGIPLGVFGTIVFLSLFLYRSGHERAHRAQVLREQRREELQHQRPERLELIHEHPSIEEELPR